MSEENIYDEIEIEVRTPCLVMSQSAFRWHFYDLKDMTYDAALQTYTYPCPCGDRFQIAIDDLRDGEEIAVCPSCSLMIRVIFDVDDLPKPEEEKAAPWATYRFLSIQSAHPADRMWRRVEWERCDIIARECRRRCVKPAPVEEMNY
jgi:diphthamide biosynthesis protein 3